MIHKFVNFSNEVGGTNSKNPSTIDNDLDNEVRDTIRHLIESVISDFVSNQHPNNDVTIQEENKLTNTTATPTTTEPQEPAMNNVEESKVLGSHADDLDDLGEDKTKDMVILRNLEISPPPPPPPTSEETSAKKRRRTATPESTPDLNESSESTGRSKRQRTQTKLFQVGDANLSAAQQNTITQSTNDLPDVICYEKNDYLAIRNEEGTFYLCQLVENVRAQRQSIKVKWLDTNNGGKTYFLTSQYDKVPQKSIIMPVNLDKLKTKKKGEQIFTLDDQVRDNVLERLKRSLNATLEANSSQ